LWHCHNDKIIVRVQPVHLMHAEQYHTTVNHWTKPTDLGQAAACRLLLSTPKITI